MQINEKKKQKILSGFRSPLEFKRNYREYLCLCVCVCVYPHPLSRLFQSASMLQTYLSVQYNVFLWALSNLGKGDFFLNQSLLSQTFTIHKTGGEGVLIQKCNLRYAVPLNVLTIRSANSQLIRFCCCTTDSSRRISLTQQLQELTRSIPSNTRINQYQHKCL